MAVLFEHLAADVPRKRPASARIVCSPIAGLSASRETNVCRRSCQRYRTPAALHASSHALRHEPVGRLISRSYIVGFRSLPANPILWNGKT